MRIFFSRLFGRTSGTRSSSKFGKAQSLSFGRHSESSRIRYDDTLVGKLKADHAEIFRLFNEINVLSEGGDYAILPERLIHFRRALQTHLMLENVMFYAYVEQHLAHDAELVSFVHDVKREMDVISRSIMRFINTYKTRKAIEENIIQFKKELKEMADVLIERISLEETRLYTLYMPSL